MPQDALSIWKDEFKKLPVTGGAKGQGPTNVSNYIDKRVTKKLETKNSIIKFDPSPIYTWKKQTFKSLIEILGPSPDPVSPRLAVSNAWLASVLESPLIIAAGAQMNPPPPGTNGIVGAVTATIDVPSATIASQVLFAALLAAGAAPTADASIFPDAFNTAFNGLTFTISGIDTTPTPAGPIPILLPFTGVE